jgi:arabinose-5-phosphate isomerase
MQQKKIIALAIETLEIEAKAIENLKQFINNDFAKCIELLVGTKGHVIVTGIGKSAIIAQKMVATFNSTGTPAAFMHAADAIHGDLGIIQKDDVIICISNSGNTPEIKLLAPLLKNGGNMLIAMTGNTTSVLAQHADFVLNTSVTKEACPNNLAPTSSTTAQVAIGDALAVCALKLRGFTENDFAKYHPGGALGKKLYLKVGEMYQSNARPEVSSNDGMEKVINVMTSGRLGATAVIDKNKLVGIITDGDLRRMMQANNAWQNVLAKTIMSTKPHTVEKDMLAADAFLLMKTNNISQIIVTDKNKYLGFVHLHDFLREGII